MSTGLFLVVKIRDYWWIDFEGRAFGPLDTREEAVVKASELAEAARRFGREAQVMAPDEDELHWSPATPKPPAPSRRSTPARVTTPPMPAIAAEPAPPEAPVKQRRVSFRPPKRKAG